VNDCVYAQKMTEAGQLGGWRPCGFKYVGFNFLLEPVRPEAVSLDGELCLPTFSHFLIVNKTSLFFIVAGVPFFWLVKISKEISYRIRI